MTEQPPTTPDHLYFMHKIEALGMSADFRRSFWVLILFSAFINLFMLTVPIYMLQVYDRVLTSQSIDTLLVLTVLVVGLLGVMSILDVSRSQMLTRLSARFELLASKKLMAAFLTSPKPTARKDDARMMSDLESLKRFLSSPVFTSLFDMPWAPFYLLLLFLIHPLYGLISLIAAALLVLFAFLSDYLTKARQLDGAAQLARSRVLAHSAVQSPDPVIAMGMADTLSAKYQRDSQNGLLEQTKGTDTSNMMGSSSRLVRLLAQVAILGFGAWLVIEQEITAGIMIAASLIMSRALAPFERLLGSWQGFLLSRQAFNRLTTFLCDYDKQKATLLPVPEQLSLELNDAGIRFPGSDQAALSHITMSIRPGQAIGIIGPNSAGKTTLARLLVGALRPTQGSMAINDTDVHMVSVSLYGKQVGYLPQDIQLLEASVYDNIARFEADKLEEVIKIAKIAGIHKHILSLPDGYDTMLGRMGIQLSGGQSQLLGLARAIYGNPSLIVLDEPNANLDIYGEKSLFSVMQYCKKINAAIVIISHKPNIMEQLDYLYVLKDGQIDFSGNPKDVHKKLLRKPGKPN